MALLKLTVEEFRLVFNFLDHEDLFRLVFACPALKQLIMTTSSVYRVVIRDSWGKVTLPAVICELPYLRELVVVNRQYRYEVPLAQLPNTLWKLELRHFNSFAAFCGIETFTYIGGMAAEDREKIVDLKSILPELRTLIIEGSHYGVTNIHKIVPFLPSSLTYLELGISGMGPLLPKESLRICLNQLPYGLVTLKLVSCSQFTPNNDISHLSHLERLSLPNCANTPILPASLTHLTLRIPPTSTDLNAQLPDLLRLYFLDIFDQTAFTVPSKLVKYSISKTLLALSAQRSVLPTSLTKLICAGFTLGASPPNPGFGVDKSSWVSGILPSSLKTIHCSRNIEFSLSNFDSARQLQRFLPLSLESFNLDLDNLNLKYLRYLPHTLRSLPSAVQISKISFIEHGGDFPEMSQAFDMASILPYLERVTLSGGNEQQSPFTFLFPSTLVELNVVLAYYYILPKAQHSFFELHRGRWPVNLRNLHYRDCFFPTDDGLSGLPSSLVSLHLHSTLTERHSDDKAALEFTERGLSALPPKLKRLEISSKMENVAPSFFAHLPQTLTSLDLPFYDDCHDEDIQHLPNSILRIGLRNSTKLTNAAIPFLPTSLTYLDIRRNRIITPECLPLLPKGLKWLDLRKNANFPKRMEVPPSLHLKTKYISEGW